MAKARSASRAAPLVQTLVYFGQDGVALDHLTAIKFPQPLLDRRPQALPPWFVVEQ